MGTSDTSAAGSLEVKLRSFIEGLTDAEAGVLGSMVDPADSSEVVGFSAGQPPASGPDTSLSLSLLISNILKTRHDTAKNSISNVR